MRRIPLNEVVVFIAGLLAATAAGVVGYREVGLYGDGPFASGFHRERDPVTGRSQLIRRIQTSKGVIERVTVDTQLVGLRADSDGDGTTELDMRVSGVERTPQLGAGFSLANDGVIDAWAFYDANKQLVRIEVSTKRNGRIDRWEHYANDQLVRVDMDTDQNGKVDRWSLYEDGILLETIVDANEDGQPDAR